MRITGMDQLASEPAVQKTQTSGQDVQIFNRGKSTKFEEKVKPSKEEQISQQEVFRAIERANDKVMVRNTELRFSVHEKTKGIMIKVMNTDTQEVIREIPSERILDMVANFMEFAGLYVDKEV